MSAIIICKSGGCGGTCGRGWVVVTEYRGNSEFPDILLCYLWNKSFLVSTFSLCIYTFSLSLYIAAQKYLHSYRFSIFRSFQISPIISSSHGNSSLHFGHTIVFFVELLLLCFQLFYFMNCVLSFWFWSVISLLWRNPRFCFLVNGSDFAVILTLIYWLRLNWISLLVRSMIFRCRGIVFEENLKV